MKKLISSLMIGFMSIALAACGSNDEGQKSTADAQSKTTQQDQEKQMKAIQKKLDKQKIDEKKTVAVVNDKKINGSEYNNLLSTAQMQYQQAGQDPTTADAAKQIKQQTLDSLIGQTLLLEEADKKGYKASDQEINKQLDESKKQYKSDQEFNTALKKAGLNLSELKSDIAANIKAEKYIKKEVPQDKVTNEEIKSYYDQYAAQQKDSKQKTPKLEDVKSQIKQMLEQQKRQEKLGQQVEKLKKSAEIDIKI
ncbi:SurA N-terminal domain-containing protein [Bacillus sonorensis]|uniref:peptidylprolyl isomerase n=2 Tax=Bacillus sonorensis TaxID=119858 RepID=M5NZU4_9BACI|nr:MULTISPECIES: SurA N-terminal domain-containing protein [Bacillus]TWK73963.1 Chaperone SurA [Bacillus paralicheniformis]ASB91259.1 Peptidylprolyl isomerase [Bacillus sonorensis]EME72698.1 hypothetical protein BSONL12_20555 [Bacillus sonorensis L12]MBG9917389.1 peptidylprolyl isomerase [Bacillus sonorensis]MCY7857156.1 SurA N-terminal domain-containing protein [Bacillus sonorensis]